jgi:hypothetical protein
MTMPNFLTRFSILALLVCLFASGNAKAATILGTSAEVSGSTRVTPASDVGSGKLIAIPQRSTREALTADENGSIKATLDTVEPRPLKTAGTGLTLVGNLTFSTGASGVRMTVDHISNTRSSGTSGPLRLALWATTTVPVFGNTITAFTLGTFDLSPLAAGFEYNNVDSGFVAFTPPPPGCYYITVALEELSSGTYFYNDLVTFTSGGVPDGSGFDRFSYGGANCSGAFSCVRDSFTACLLNGRFQVTVTYRTSTTNGNAQVMNFSSSRAESDESAFFWFFNSSNFEMGLKMLNACSLNNRFWVYISGLTDQGWTVTIIDTQTGVSTVYQNNLNHLSSTVADTGTLRCP